MKTKIISLVVLFMTSMMSMSITNQAIEKNIILIQPVENNVSTTSLTESAKIITARLKDFSSDKFKVTVIPGKNQIQVIGMESMDISSVENLLIQKGKIEFYRAYNHIELSELLKGDNHLFSILNMTDVRKTDSKIGCTSLAEIEKVNAYIHSTVQNKKCRYAWSDFSDSSKICLYALRLEHNKGSLLTGKDIDSVKYNHNKEAGYWYLNFNFKKPAVKVWADITKKNIGNSIAIVIDNHVICAPVINTVIVGGKCQVTGNFTELDVKLIAALGNHGELPVNFKVVK